MGDGRTTERGTLNRDYAVKADDTFDDFFDTVMGLTKVMWEGVKGGDDGESFVAFHLPEGQVMLMPAGEFMSSERLKSLLGDQIMPTVVRTTGATRYALSSGAWGIDFRDVEDQETAARKFMEWRQRHPRSSLRDHPACVEVVTVTIGEWTGRMAETTTQVSRDAKGVPTLTGWREREESNWRTGNGGPSGRFVDAVMRELTGTKRNALDIFERMFDRFPGFKRVFLGELEAVCEQHGIEFDGDHPFSDRMVSEVSKHTHMLHRRVSQRMTLEAPDEFDALTEALMKEYALVEGNA